MTDAGIPRQGRHSFPGDERAEEHASWAADRRWDRLSGAGSEAPAGSSAWHPADSPSWDGTAGAGDAARWTSDPVAAGIGANRAATTAARYADRSYYSHWGAGGFETVPGVPLGDQHRDAEHRDYEHRDAEYRDHGHWDAEHRDAAPSWRHRPGSDDGPSYDSGPLPADTGSPSRRPATDSSAAGSGASVPPLPTGAWSRLQPRSGSGADDAPTEGAGMVAADGRPDWDDDGSATVGRELHPDLLDPNGAALDREHADALDWDDRTGGLEVIGAHVDDEPRPARGWRRRKRRGADDGHVQDDLDQFHAFADDDLHGDDLHGDDRHGDDRHGDDRHGDDRHGDDLHGDDDRGIHDEDIPVLYDAPRKRGRRRRWIAVLLALVVVAGAALGVVVGGQKLVGLFTSRDYTGPGSGSVQIRVTEGETLSAIGKTLVAQGVVADVRPFVKAAEANPRATSITPGLYSLRHQMSGQAALDQLLNPTSRLFSRVTLPEGLTAKQTLQRLADGTGTPLPQLQAAAAAPATLGLPAYANGNVEGFLFPATYEFEPGTSATDMLRAQIARTVQVLDKLQVPAERRLAVVTQASMVQAESGSIADMPKVARVLENRLQKGQALQLDTTVNYATGKRGLTTTDQDRANPSPYNTYVHPGLPPGAISNPGEEALRAVQSPAPGNSLYFVVVNPDTGETRFAATLEEHQRNVLVFQQWLRAHPGA